MRRPKPSQAIGSYIQYLEEEVAPKARASFRLGREMFERKLKLDEGITLDADRLLAIALREFQATQDEFRTLAGKLDGGDPIAAWRKAKDEHPAPGALVGGGAAAARRAQHVHRSQRHRHAARRRAGDRRADAGVLSLVVREHVGARARSSRSRRARYYYLTDADPSWPADKQEEHLRDFNYPTLWAISIHEVYPGPLPALPVPSPRRIEGAQVASCSRPRRSSKDGRTTPSR